MVFEYFVRPFVSHYYHLFMQKVVRIHWDLFGSTADISVKENPNEIL